MGFSCTDRLWLSGFGVVPGRKKHRIPELTKRSFFMPGRLPLPFKQLEVRRVLMATKGSAKAITEGRITRAVAQR